jgi:hypothetical protein
MFLSILLKRYFMGEEIFCKGKNPAELGISNSKLALKCGVRA